MRQEINWRTRRPDKTIYDVRVARWAGEMKFQFKEKGEERWDSEKKPELQDWEDLLDALERRYARKQSTDKEIDYVKKQIAQVKAGATSS